MTSLILATVLLLGTATEKGSTFHKLLPAPREAIEVSGAGTATLNGVYVATGTLNSHTRYLRDDGAFVGWRGVISDPEQGQSLLEWGLFAAASSQALYWAEVDDDPYAQSWFCNQLIYIPPFAACPEPSVHLL